MGGFCDSEDGRLFHVRFMPRAAGRYRWQAAYKDGAPEVGAEGTFEAVDGGRKGLLRVDPEHPWHFVWEGPGARASCAGRRWTT